MSNTPETDKNTWSDSSEGVLHNVVTADFARKLERERDEAQYKLEDARQSLEVALEDLSEANRERDEAREIIRKAKAKFCEEGADGNIASEMFSILSGAK